MNNNNVRKRGRNYEDGGRWRKMEEDGGRKMKTKEREIKEGRKKYPSAQV